MKHCSLVRILQSIGYSTSALSHSIDHVKIRNQDRDIAAKTIPSSVIEYGTLNSGGVELIELTPMYSYMGACRSTSSLSIMAHDFIWK
jgi:hypothetical protein